MSHSENSANGILRVVKAVYRCGKGLVMLGAAHLPEQLEGLRVPALVVAAGSLILQQLVIAPTNLPPIGLWRCAVPFTHRPPAREPPQER